MTDQLRIVDAFKMNLDFLMFELKMSKEDLGKKVNVSRQAVDKLFKSDNIETRTMGMYATALGFEETDLTDPNFKAKYYSKDIK